MESTGITDQCVGSVLYSHKQFVSAPGSDPWPIQFIHTNSATVIAIDLGSNGCEVNMEGGGVVFSVVSFNRYVIFLETYGDPL
jgi:hypothetical protein